MAFGKKKDDDAKGAVAELEAGSVSEADAVESEPAALAAVEGVAADAAPADEAEAPADPLAGAGGDSLLNMFSTSQIETVDNSKLVDMVGEVDMDDLLESLHVVAAAMGIVVAEESYARAA